MKIKKNNTTVAITGASGFVGRELVKHFSSNNIRVLALVRYPTQQPVIKNVTYIHYDVLDPLPSKLLKNVDTLIHTAYIKYSSSNPNALESNITGAKNILQNCKMNNVSNILFMSTMSAHNETVSVYGKQKLAIEALFKKENGVILRCGLIIGNGGIVKEMSDFMKSKHVVPLVNGGRQPLQIIAIYDLIRVIDKMINNQIRGLYTVATPEIYEYKFFYRALAKSINVHILFIPIPFSTLLLLFKVASILRLPLGVGKDNLMGLKMLKSVDNISDMQKIGLTIDSLGSALENIKQQRPIA